MNARAYSGELFAGTGMLGRAVGEVFGTRPRWFCEFDTAPSKVLAHHYPDVPNYGDVTKVDFTTVPHTHVRAGGFPCQDVSVSGARAGLRSGTRSGLWSEFARSIAEDRPDWVVIENVGGLLSAEAHSDVEPCPWCLGDEPGEPALRALGAVLADLATLGFDAEWTSIRASDVGAPHGRLRVFILAWPRERTTPDSAGQRQSVSVPGRHETGSLATACHRDAAADADDGTGDWERARAGSGLGGTEAPLSLLPTPQAADGTGGRIDKGELGGFRDSGAKRAITLASVVHHQLLPTPGAYDGERGGSQHPDKRRDGGHSVTLQDVAEHALMPTPRASRGGSATETMYALGAERDDEGDRQGNVTGEVSSWGPYAAAIARWESVVGRTAPAPVRPDGKGGKSRLNPELTEWMMGWPCGWVTASVVGLSRAEQLKACGNGVVLQQAIAALRMLLARPGVPPIEWVLAA